MDAALLRVLCNLQKKHGEAFASEAGLRLMIAQDTGHMPGQDTVRRALVRLGREGAIVQVPLAAGGIRPDGMVCTYGTRLVAVPQCRRQRRALRARARDAPPPAESRRINRRALEELATARRTIAKTIGRPDNAPAEVERRRREQLAELARARAELEELGSPQERPPPE